MVNEQVLNYLKEELSKGYSLDQLTQSLLNSGYSKEDIDQAIRELDLQTNNFQNNNINTPNNRSYNFKNRNLFMIFILSVITFGFYLLYWSYSIAKELSNYTEDGPKPWLVFLSPIPLVNIIVYFIFYWKLSKAIEKITNFNKVILYILFIFFFIIGVLVAQNELNKISSK